MKLIIVILTSVITACSQDVKKTELVGTYKFTFNNQIQAIVIAPDGHYTNTFYQDGKVVWVDSATWSYSNLANERGVVFEDFQFGMQEYSSGGVWFVVPKYTIFRKRELCFDLDLDRCFVSEDS